MNVKEMYRSMLGVKILLIFVGFMVFSVGVTALWIGVGILLLLGGAFMMFRTGQSAGHESCAISKSVADIGYDKADNLMKSRMWSISNGVRTIFAGAAVMYTLNVIYIILMLLNVNDTVKVISRAVSWILTMPYWPIIAYWHESYASLTTDIILVLMISPFVMPVCYYFGYLQGPKLWKKTEQAMANGRRRAKARSRIVKKNKLPKPMKPEI